MKPLGWRQLSLGIGSIAVLFLTLDVSPGPSATEAALQNPAINAQGTFTDRAGWVYLDASSTTSISPPYSGTNEFLQLPSPSPPSGGAVVGVEILRHPSDEMGYPVHISMLVKTYASMKALQMVYLADSATSLYRYDVAQTIWNQTAVRGVDNNKEVLGAIGPMAAESPAPDKYRTAADFAKLNLQAITNLPTAQKLLGNYDLGLVETKDMMWVEFEPHFGPSESPHLGCQTQLGRDMAFGFMKADLAQNRNASRFLQCF